jgi:hypothetical protein
VSAGNVVLVHGAIHAQPSLYSRVSAHFLTLATRWLGLALFVHVVIFVHVRVCAALVARADAVFARRGCADFLPFTATSKFIGDMEVAGS